MSINNLSGHRLTVTLKRWNRTIYRTFAFVVMLMPLAFLCGINTFAVWNVYLSATLIISVILLNTAIVFEIVQGIVNTRLSFKEKSKSAFVRNLLFLLFSIILLVSEFTLFSAPSINL